MMKYNGRGWKRAYDFDGIRLFFFPLRMHTKTNEMCNEILDALI